MSVLIVGDDPEVAEWLRRRRDAGQDGFDEVWDGVYHVSPNAGSEHGQVTAQVLIALEPLARAAGLASCGPFNLGTGEQNFRVPDGGWFSRSPGALYVPTAVMVLEVLSPDDETYDKFDFYAERSVVEILVVHPIERWARCWQNAVTGGYTEVEHSRVMNIAPRELSAQIRWP